MQYNGQQKEYNGVQKTTHKTIDKATRTTLKTYGGLMYPCSTCNTSAVLEHGHAGQLHSVHVYL